MLPKENIVRDKFKFYRTSVQSLAPQKLLLFSCKLKKKISMKNTKVINYVIEMVLGIFV